MKSSFRRMAAAALMLMIGAATAVGCGGTTNAEGSTTVVGDAGTEPDASQGAGGATPDASVSDAATDGPVLIDAAEQLPDAGFDAGEGRPDTGFDASPPDGCEPELVSALVDCSPNQAAAQRVVDCACVLNDSWRGGMAELFAEATCDEISGYFGCCGFDTLCNLAMSSSLPAELDLDYLMDYSCCLVYLGIRCD